MSLWQRRQKWMPILGRLFGVVLVGVAVAFALRQVDPHEMLQVDAGGVAVLALLIVTNIFLTGVLFWAITRSFDARPVVGQLRMVELIALSGLLNYIPLLRPGLWGRAAYLKTRHQLPIRQSVLIMAVVFALSIVVLGSILGALVFLSPPICWWVLGAAGLILTFLTVPVGRRLLGREIVQGWLWVPLRLVDAAVAAFRLWLAFRLIGHPILFSEALVLGSVGLAVRLVGLTPNGIGLSEWLVAAVAAAITPVSLAYSTAAALLDRAAEVVVSVVCGGLAAWHLGGGFSPRSEPEDEC